MKPVLILFLVLTSASGCHKSGIAPQHTGKTSGDTTKTGGFSQTPPDTTPKLTHDDSIHLATFSLKPQIVKTTQSGKKLTLVYHEDVSLLFAGEGYLRTSAVHLHEDFSKSALAGLDYTTVAQGGNITLNWVDDNLNNVILKTVTDTSVNGHKMVKITVRRAFTFVKNYSTADEAGEGQKEFAARQNDVVTFSSYCYYNQKVYRPASISGNLVYSGGN